MGPTGPRVRSPWDASVPRLGSPLPHLLRDWARRCHICSGTGPTPATSAPGLGSPLPHRRQDLAGAHQELRGGGRLAQQKLNAQRRQVGDTMEVYWPAEKMWFTGTVMTIDDDQCEIQNSKRCARRAIGTVLCGLQRVAAVQCNAWSESGRIAA